MKIHYLILLFLSMLVTGAAQAQSDKGAGLYNARCAACHGARAEKIAANIPVAVRTLSRSEVLIRFEIAREGDVKSAGDRAKASLSEEEAQWVADYIMQLSDLSKN